MKMKTTRSTKVLLMVSGLVAVGVGAALLFAPVAFQASAGIVLGDNVNLLSEMRAPGGALLASGVIILMGAFNPAMTPPALMLSALIYLSYGVSRLFSMAVDGMPHGPLIGATGFEILIGLLSLLALRNMGKKHRTAGSRWCASRCTS